MLMLSLMILHLEMFEEITFYEFYVFYFVNDKRDENFTSEENILLMIKITLKLIGEKKGNTSFHLLKLWYLM